MKNVYLLLCVVALLLSCKDSDGDKIYDKDDACPDTYGLAEFNGCPDTDEDGIQDSEDDCPEDYGLEEFNGCPDTDEDGIPDNEDDCPDTYGYERYNGCPNNDHVQLLVSECFESFSFTSDEINQLLAEKGYTLNSTINVGICNILVEMIVMKRKHEQERRMLEEEERRLNARGVALEKKKKDFNEMGYLQAVYRQGNGGQYIVVLKGGANGTYYLMQVISGGKCETGKFLKFDETTFNTQEVWIKDEPFKIPATLYRVKILNSSKRPFDLNKLFN